MRAAPGTFFGTRFVLNVWEPYVQYDTEFSLAQTWLVSGSGSNLNSIEAGFQVSYFSILINYIFVHMHAKHLN